MKAWTQRTQTQYCNKASYPVTPPEERNFRAFRVLGYVRFQKRGKTIQTHFVGGKQRSHTHPSQQQQSTNNNRLLVSTELRRTGSVWFCLVCFYIQGLASILYYIQNRMQGVPSTHWTGTVTVVNLKRERRNLRVLRQTDPCGLLTYTHLTVNLHTGATAALTSLRCPSGEVSVVRSYSV